jgi:FixJ family two-component response regulator
MAHSCAARPIRRAITEFAMLPMPLVAASNAIAIVDDDAAVRSALAFLFEIEGYAVQTFSTARGFLDRSAGEEPCCLIVDQNMPGMTGLELVVHLRRNGAAWPIIMITATLDPALESQARAAGVTRVIEKPVFGNGLIEAVTACLSHRDGV